MSKSIGRPRWAFTPAERRALLVLSLILLVGILFRGWFLRSAGGVEVIDAPEACLKSEPKVAPALENIVEKDSASLDICRQKALISSPSVPSQGLAGSVLSESDAQTDQEGNDNSRVDVASVLIDINYASSNDLMALPGIGKVLAERIIDWRELHGSFQKVEDLLLVRGIGSKRLEQIRPHISVKP